MFSNFSPVLYVQIWENRIRVLNIETGNVFDDVPLVSIGKDKAGKNIITAIGSEASNKEGDEIINPFLHPRTLVKDFTIAEKLLQHSFRKVHGKILSLSPIVIIHPNGKDDGGLTQIERRVFRELAFGAGAKKSFLHLGKPLDTSHINLDEINSAELAEDYPNRDVETETTTFTKIFTWLVFISMGYGLFLAFSNV